MSLPEPFYADDAVTIYHADCRDVLPELPCNALVSDPVWPNATVDMPGIEAPQQLLADMFNAMPELPARAAIHLGVDSDPRFLTAVPEQLEFFRVAWLEIVRMGYKGRLGMTGDVAYLFGHPPPARPGQHIIPGRMIDADPNGQSPGHPCPRKLGHSRWLVNWWSAPGDVVVDPFMGSGTTLRAAKDLGRKAIGVEIEERYCEAAVERLAQGVLDFGGAA